MHAPKILFGASADTTDRGVKRLNMVIYLIGFSLAFYALAFWFLRKRTAGGLLWGPLCMVGLVVYLAGLALVDAPAVYRLQILARDFLFLGASGAFFGYLAGRRRWFFVGLGIATLALGLFMRQVQYPAFSDAVPIILDEKGEFLVELREGAGPAALEGLRERYKLRIERAFYPADAGITDLDNYFMVDIPGAGAAKVRRIARLLRSNKAVVWVEGNEQVLADPLTAQSPPDKADDHARYGLDDPGVGNLWAFRQMSMEKFFGLLEQEKVKPVKKALVAILDTGVDARHEDLRGNYRSLKPAFDSDPKGHGTHCAGIAAAVSNNGLGIASFSRDNAFYLVTAVKVLGAGGIGTQKTIIEGMLYAADNGADVLSMSLGGPSNQPAQRAYQKAVAYAAAKGAIVVAAAGNSNRNARDFSPANTPGLICVSAVDAGLNRALFSNFVKEIPMAVAAAGVDIYSTIPGNQYAAYSGTSMAAPQVAGLLGLMKSIRPDLTAKAAFDILHDSGKQTKDTPMTGKFIQPHLALRSLLDK